MCYAGRMLSIGWVMFWKAVVLTAWTTYQEIRDERRRKGVDPLLVAIFNQEWQRRRAKQPLALTDRTAGTLEDGRSLEQ